MNYTLFLIFVIVVVLIAIDRNIEDYLILLFKIVKLKIESLWWRIRLHPKNPITNLTMRFKYDKIARELEKELNDSLRDQD
jgi:hypothetical protein